MNSDTLTAQARIRIRRSPEEAFNAFADAGAMSKFWFTRRDEGLKEGESVTWFVGNGAEAPSFAVYVKELVRPHKIVIEWGHDEDHFTQVTWTFLETEEGDTRLTIEESGYSGDSAAIIARALDSTGGFNQVIVAAKALVEHGVALNVVADHV